MTGKLEQSYETLELDAAVGGTIREYGIPWSRSVFRDVAWVVIWYSSADCKCHIGSELPLLLCLISVTAVHFKEKF